MQWHYLKQRDAMCSTLDESFTSDMCRYVLPQAGMFLWLEFQRDFLRLDSMQVFASLAADGVVVVPGGDFRVPLVGESADCTDLPLTLRLSFAAASPDAIVEGVRRLASGINKLARKS
jgi:DNA-binding transcriptional MocR family regulator